MWLKNPILWAFLWPLSSLKIIDRRSVKCVTYGMWTCSLWEQFNLIDNKVSVWCTHALQIMFSGIKINVESRARSIFLKLSRPFLSKYRLQSAHFIRQVEEPKFVNSWHLTEIVWEAWNELLRWNSSQITYEGRFLPILLTFDRNYFWNSTSMSLKQTSNVMHKPYNSRNLTCLWAKAGHLRK